MGRKPKILFVVDKAGWAHDNKAKNLKENLSDYSIEIIYHDELSEYIDINKVDLVVVFYWYQLRDNKILWDKLRGENKLLLGVCSHSELEQTNLKSAIGYFNEARAIFAVNYNLYESCSIIMSKPVFYTPNGVNTSLFYPNKRNVKIGQKITIGWAGSLKDHGNNHKGFGEFILPLEKNVQNIELIVADREQNFINHNEMAKFYNSLDIYICASKDEGTPNPCLEAAACGIPVLTTRVGNMTELIKHGENGFFIERDIKDIIEKIKLLSLNETLRQQMSANIHKDIQDWDWTVKAKNYKQMFDTILS